MCKSRSWSHRCTGWRGERPEGGSRSRRPGPPAAWRVHRPPVSPEHLLCLRPRPSRPRSGVEPLTPRAGFGKHAVWAAGVRVALEEAQCSCGAGAPSPRGPGKTTQVVGPGGSAWSHAGAVSSGACWASAQAGCVTLNAFAPLLGPRVATRKALLVPHWAWLSRCHRRHHVEG